MARHNGSTPGLGLMVPPYDAPPTSTGTNRASYLLRSRLPRLHTFSASFSAIQIFQHTFRNCALVIDLDFIADSLAESRKFLVGLHHLSTLRSQGERRYWGSNRPHTRKFVRQLDPSDEMAQVV